MNEEVEVQSEPSPRQAHHRFYSKDERRVSFYVDSIGTVQITEEVLDTILTELGYQEVGDEY